MLKIWINNDQVDRFIKKATKIYKALQVLEKQKVNETPDLSKSLDKLMRYFRKKFPEDLNLDKSLLDLSRSNDSSTQPYFKTEFNGSEFSADLKAELDDINKGIGTTIGEKSSDKVKSEYKDPPDSVNQSSRNALAI